VGRLYTRTGDAGQTGLRDGARLPKDSERVQAYGDLDELNSYLGLVVTVLPSELAPVREVVRRVQHELFILGAEIATSPAEAPRPPLIEKRHVERLESDIDRYSEVSSSLRHFVLPQGGPPAAALHVARTVARRAERSLARLNRREPLRPASLAYMNRLSDLLFALSLWVNHEQGVPEVPPDYGI